jgi:hypothetical protein
MTLKITDTTHVDPTGGNQTTAISSLFTLTSTSNPTYLVVNALDRNEYTVASNDKTGHFSSNGATLNLTAVGGDARGAGIIYTWRASTGQYVNATYGTLSQLCFTGSTSANDVTNVSFFGTNSAATAQANASSAYALMQTDASGYLGSTTFATSASFTTPPPTQATPNGIAATALSFVGHAWNNEGCWVLASTIAAESGAGLPIQSTALHVAGATNGEWFTLYNGKAWSPPVTSWPSPPPPRPATSPPASPGPEAPPCWSITSPISGLMAASPIAPMTAQPATSSSPPPMPPPRNSPAWPATAW